MAWLILTLVFVDELLAVAAAAVWGTAVGGWPLGVGAAMAAVVVWALFASPRAAYGGPLARPLAKVLVFGLASAGLWAAGHPGWALALLAFSVVVNALAQLPAVVAVQRGLEAPR